jgi:hypothetical protein
MNIYSNFMHNCQTLLWTRCFSWVNRWVVHPDNGILFSARRKWTVKPWKDKEDFTTLLSEIRQNTGFLEQRNYVWHCNDGDWHRMFIQTHGMSCFSKWEFKFTMNDLIQEIPLNFYIYWNKSSISKRKIKDFLQGFTLLPPHCSLYVAYISVFVGKRCLIHNRRRF